MTHDLEFQPWTDDELDRTLADLLEVSAEEQPAATPSRLRWLVPVAAAAAVTAVLAAAFLPRSAGPGPADAARALSVQAGVADVGGVRFPVPDGWTVAVTAADDDAVTACVAAAPAAPCNGVEIVLAVPDGPALPDSVTDEVLGPGCTGGGGGFVLVDPSVPLGGRAGVHYFGGSCTMDGPQAHVWVTQDMSLAITTPPGRWASEGAAIVAGLDLAGWPREPGPVLLYRTEANSLPQPTG